MICKSGDSNSMNNYVNGLFGLNGKNILVTGCSGGIGYCICEALAQAGASNVIGTYNLSDFIQTKQCVEKYGSKFHAKKVDFSHIKDIDLNMLFDEFESNIGKIDILINNAGINLRNKFLEYKQSDWDKVLDVNLKSVLFLSQQFAKINIEKNHTCKIINIASLLSFQGGNRCVAYTASKHGILGITKLMANELGKYGINVNCIMPGYIKTKMTMDFMDNTEISQPCLNRIPLQRWGKCDDLVGAILFLASKASDYVNGASIVVDGGYLNM